MDKSGDMGKNIVLITNRDDNAVGEEDIEAPTLRDTLDEKISETLQRDMTMILHKIEYVLKPRSVAESHKQLKNLWGPLIFCLVLSM
jgi:hypothetical protein